jgi:lipoate-protein ligase A
MLNHHLLKVVQDAEEYRLSDADLNSIKELIQTKYSTREWNFGYSPAYRFKNEMTFPQGVLSCVLSVEKGIISEIVINGEALSASEKESIQKGMIKKPHHPESLMNLIGNISPLALPTEQLLKFFV